MEHTTGTSFPTSDGFGLPYRAFFSAIRQVPEEYREKAVLHFLFYMVAGRAPTGRPGGMYLAPLNRQP